MTPPLHSMPWPLLAAERADASYDAGTDRRDSNDDLIGALDGVTIAVGASPIEAMRDGEIEAQLAALVTARRRLEAREARLTAELTRRRTARARATSGGDARAAERAAQQVRSELAESLRLSPTQVKKAQQVGKRVSHPGPIAEALDAGVITPDHVQAMDRTLDHLTGDQRREARDRLLQVATTGTPRDVHDAGTRLLAVMDPESAEEAAEARHRRRSGKVWKTRHGTLRVSAELEGLDAESFATAFHAWRRPDRPGEHRTPEQRSADALGDMARASVAGRSDVASPTTTPPTNHGVRPHIAITVDLDTVLVGTGVAETQWTGPVLWQQVRHLLDDANLSFIAVRDEVPIAVTEDVRTVPAGLWRALQLRDRGCVRAGCDAPATWCQVAHLGRPFRDGGKLRLGNAGLLCTGHHREFDAGRATVTWAESRPTTHPPDRPPP